jgi:REP element-mobilizing transposase RayT
MDFSRAFTPKALHSEAQGRRLCGAPWEIGSHTTKPQRGFTNSLTTRAMPQSLAEIYVHIVFSTKNRQPFLQNRAFRDRTHGYLKGICDGQDSPSIRIGGVEDHVHILCRLGKTLDVSKLIRELKRESSKWIKAENQQLKDFYWQNGYGAFSVSPSHVPALKQYIAEQEEHHRKESFQDEFRRLCVKYGAAIDERYVWD